MTTAKRQRIRVCLRSYEHKLVDVSAEKIVETAKRTDAKVAGPIPLPTKRRIYCVLRSPHVDKNLVNTLRLELINVLSIFTNLLNKQLKN